jgi:hypothetical protein
MSLQPTASEINVLQNVEKERFQLIMPPVKYHIWSNKSEQDTRWGHFNDIKFSSEFNINCDYDWERKIKIYKDGTWIKSNLIKMYISRRQWEDILTGLSLSIVPPKEGDVIFVMNRFHRVLRVEPMKLIQGTAFEYLNYELRIDTKRAIQE